MMGNRAYHLNYYERYHKNACVYVKILTDNPKKSLYLLSLIWLNVTARNGFTCEVLRVVLPPLSRKGLIIQIIVFASICVKIIKPLVMVPNMKELLLNARKQQTIKNMARNNYVKNVLSKLSSTGLANLRRSHRTHKTVKNDMDKFMAEQLNDKGFMTWLRQRNEDRPPLQAQSKTKPQKDALRMFYDDDDESSSSSEEERITQRPSRPGIPPPHSNQSIFEVFQSVFPYDIRGRDIIQELEEAYKNNTIMYNEATIEKDAYLLVRPSGPDIYATVIPNHLYYDIEKKCVNWLTSCSIRGLREEFINKITSP